VSKGYGGKQVSENSPPAIRVDDVHIQGILYLGDQVKKSEKQGTRSEKNMDVSEKIVSKQKSGRSPDLEKRAEVNMKTQEGNNFKNRGSRRVCSFQQEGNSKRSAGNV